MVQAQDKTQIVEYDEAKLVDLEVQHMKNKQEELENVASTDDASKKDKKEKKEKEPSVPIYKLFRYASPLDLLLVALACIGSIALGVLQPVAVCICT